MPFYLSEYIGAGTRLDPYRPVGSDQPGWAAIDLRGGGKGPNACLLYLPVHNPDGKLQQFADVGDERMGAATQDAVEQTFPRTWQKGLTAQEWVRQLLVDPAPDTWKPAQPGPDGVLEVVLGPARTAQASIRGGTDLLDDATRADNASLGAGWEELGDDAWAIASNRFSTSGAMSSTAIYQTPLRTNDVQAEVDLVTWTHLSTQIISTGVAARLVSGADVDQYQFTAAVIASPTLEHAMSKFVGGVHTLLATHAQDPAGGTRLYLKCSGTTISGGADATQLTSVTDTDVDGTVVGGKYAGMIGFAQDAGHVQVLDNWRAFDLVQVRSKIGGPGLRSKLHGVVR